MSILQGFGQFEFAESALVAISENTRSTTTGIIKDPPKPVTGKCERPVGEGNGKRGSAEHVPGDSKPAANALPSGRMPWEERPRDEKPKEEEEEEAASSQTKSPTQNSQSRSDHRRRITTRCLNRIVFDRFLIITGIR